MSVKRIARGLGYGLLALAGVLLLLAAVGYVALRGSLAQVEGRRTVRGLTAPVTVDRDALGIPRIQAQSRQDLAFAMGFTHAQDRFFQMDLMRRNAAGELAAILGPALLEVDFRMRRHRLAASAAQALESLSAPERSVLEAYTQGVNSGLQALHVRPPEYLVLRTEPQPWQPRDSLLVALIMFERLQDSTGSEDLAREQWKRVVPPEVVAFLDPDGSDWEAAVDDSHWPAAPLPGPELLDLRRLAVASAETLPTAEVPLRPGSNNWGVNGKVSQTGSAIVANDMHLDLGMPNIWYRVSARWKDADHPDRRFDGVTLPGAPVFVVGSNGEIAWGFTNATLDTTDVVDLELDPQQPRRYRTPDGWRDLETVTEAVDVAGQSSRSLVFENTVWGPVISTNAQGGKRALRWLAHSPDAVNMNLLRLESVTNVAAALRIAPSCGIPVQNFLVGDRSGDLAWTLIGRLPKRVGFDGRSPVSWADGRCRWDGWWPAEQYPVQRGDRLWTANNRIVGSPEYRALGPYLTDIGARGRQIRDDLRALPKASETDLFGVYRDDRALFLERWQKLLLQVLQRADGTNGPADRAQWIAQVENWGGAAATNSAGYRLVRGFRLKTAVLLAEPLMMRARAEKQDLPFNPDRLERAWWQCLQERPAHWLNPKFATYDDLLLAALKGLDADLRSQGLVPTQATWGQRNVVRIQHPLARAVPRLSPLLDLAPVPLPGDDHMPRVQGPAFGSSERMVVSPGHEDTGLLQMPGGQSGHFLSPYYRSGSEAWEAVTPTPLLPGPRQHRLQLVPKSS